MADQATQDYYKSWLSEKHRAQLAGHPNYEANCDIEIARLEATYPELLNDKQAWWDAITK
jgi:hypothetical protein